MVRQLLHRPAQQRRARRQAGIYVPTQLEGDQAEKQHRDDQPQQKAGQVGFFFPAETAVPRQQRPGNGAEDHRARKHGLLEQILDV